MLAHDLNLLTVLTALLAGIGALLLCLAAVDVARAMCMHLWRLASPGAARQARFRTALAAYQDPLARRGTPIGWQR